MKKNCVWSLNPQSSQISICMVMTTRKEVYLEEPNANRNEVTSLISTECLAWFRSIRWLKLLHCECTKVGLGATVWLIKNRGIRRTSFKSNLVFRKFWKSFIRLFLKQGQKYKYSSVSISFCHLILQADCKLFFHSFFHIFMKRLIFHMFCISFVIYLRKGRKDTDWNIFYSSQWNLGH